MSVAVYGDSIFGPRPASPLNLGTLICGDLQVGLAEALT
jgi:hypothetical protein